MLGRRRMSHLILARAKKEVSAVASEEPKPRAEKKPRNAPWIPFQLYLKNRGTDKDFMEKTFFTECYYK